MTSENWVALVGSVAGFCTTFAFVPQVVKIWKQGGRDLSWGMLAFYMTGVLLWMIYGILQHAAAVTIANIATAILIGVAIVLKVWTGKRDAAKQALMEAIEHMPKAGLEKRAE